MRIILVLFALFIFHVNRLEPFPAQAGKDLLGIRNHPVKFRIAGTSLTPTNLSAPVRLTLDQEIQAFLNAHPDDANAEASAESLLDLLDQGRFPNISPEDFIHPALYAYFVINCAFVRSEHSDWSSWHIYLEATWQALSGATHTALDVCGLIPIGGEPCDFINGVIYTLEGNPVDAGLSFSATLPIAGWAVTGAKWAGLTVVVGAVVHHLNFRILNGLVDFGDRSLLRKILGISNPLKEAHHVIPWDKANHPLVQMAGKGNFHLNHPKNGLDLEKFRFSNPTGVHANHPGYNDKVGGLMNALWAKLTNRYNGAANVPANVARDKLIELQQSIAAHIKANPNVKINDLTLNGVNVPNVP